MRVVAALGICGLLVNCGSDPEGGATRGVQIGAGADGTITRGGGVTLQGDPASYRMPDCYTVDLFDRPTIQRPYEGMPPAHAAFLGHWADGGWQGTWCHELWITSVTPDGIVDLLELHAPDEELDAVASAFRRRGRIDANGVLRFNYGTETHVYEVRDGKLLGERSGQYGRLNVVLEKQR